MLVTVIHPSGLANQLSGNYLGAFAFALILVVLFFVASRDALRKYYSRTSALLGIRHTRKEPDNDERLAPQKGKDEVQSGGPPAGQEK